MLLCLLLVTQLANLLLYVVGCRGIYLTREDSNDDDGEYIEGMPPFEFNEVPLQVIRPFVPNIRMWKYTSNG